MALTLAKLDFATIQISVKEKFYPKNEGANLAMKEMLAGLGTAVILGGIVAGGPAAGLFTNVIAGAIGNGIMAVPNPDNSFSKLADMGMYKVSHH